jgi:hypothetical protein
MLNKEIPAELTRGIEEIRGSIERYIDAVEYASVDNVDEDSNCYIVTISVALEKPEVREPSPKQYTAKATMTTSLEATFSDADMLERGYSDPYSFAKDFLNGEDYSAVDGSGVFDLSYVEEEDA